MSFPGKTFDEHFLVGLSIDNITSFPVGVGPLLHSSTCTHTHTHTHARTHGLEVTKFFHLSKFKSYPSS